MEMIRWCWVWAGERKGVRFCGCVSVMRERMRNWQQEGQITWCLFCSWRKLWCWKLRRVEWRNEKWVWCRGCVLAMMGKIAEGREKEERMNLFFVCFLNWGEWVEKWKWVWYCGVSAMPRKREEVRERKRNGCLNAIPVLEVNIGARRCGEWQKEQVWV